MFYTSTRDKSIKVTSSQAISHGISAEGGLFVPEEIPHITMDDIVRLADCDFIERAKEIAAELEESDITANTKNIGKKHTEEVEPVQISLFDTMGMVAEQPKKSEVEETLKKLDISNMTPMEAMNQLYELQKKCK